ncbi:hypothetical protein [Burkholderia singularis]|uniref:Uncharacterized protein n=1 Tax=Burkholderia singularis TaxID=1503053 RepID=A0A238HBG2_9BURK|nr:hypothetical protein [Burkholderia singularis]SMG02327.1 hypothetical protein BSIN_0947 [Burkholderia singularis]
MEQNFAILLHRPDPPMPDVDPDPELPDPDNPPPDLPEPYRHPEGDPPEHPPPEHEPPERQPPVRAYSRQRRPRQMASEGDALADASGGTRGWRASFDARAAAVVLTAVLGAACAQPGRGCGPLPRAADWPGREGGEGGASAPVAPRAAAPPSGALSPTDAPLLPVSGAMTRTHGALCVARQA